MLLIQGLIKIMDKLLTIKNLCLSIKSTDKEILKNINFDISNSEIVSLIGESGSGKSLTALSIIRLLEKSCIIKSGEIIFKDKNILSLEEKEMRFIRKNEMSMIFQEPMRSLNPVMTIYDQLKESYVEKNINLQKEIFRNLNSVGIFDAERVIQLYPHQLSGGMKQRVMIAMAIACKPKLLIADEPTTSLDVTIQKQVLDLLSSLRKELNMAILFITHDLAVASQISDKIIVMKEGEILENSPSKDFFKKPKHNYSKSLIQSSNYMKKLKTKDVSDINNKVLDIKNLKVYYQEKGNSFGLQNKLLKAVDDISLSINAGTTHAIVGESGSGKTTIAKAIMGLTKISSGKINILDKNILSLSYNENRIHRKNYQMIFQDPFSSLNPRMRIGSIIKEGLCFLEPNINNDYIIKKFMRLLIRLDYQKIH